jgi:predicted nucleic acid-binding protein
MSGEAERHFVDTNVLVYAHDSSAHEKREIARDLLGRIWLDQSGCTSIQVLQELYATLTRKVRVPLKSAEASKIISYLSQWRVHSPEPADVLAAIQIHQRNQISFWDAMIVRSATRLGCTVIWSEDLNAGQDYAGVRVLNPFLAPLR